MPDERDIRLLRYVINAQRKMIKEREDELKGLKAQLVLWEKELAEMVEGQLILEYGEW